MPDSASAVLVFLNPNATYGTGRERWARVEAELGDRLGALEVVEVGAVGSRRPADGRGAVDEVASRLADAHATGTARFVAAGGDGTVNLLLNAIMTLPEDVDVALGAVGLGSSNDFHKPFALDGFVDDIPVRVDFESALASDVLEVRYDDERGETRTRYCLINASVGVTARANALFNEPTPFIRAARKLSVDAAISAAVLTALATWRDITCSLSLDGGRPEMASVTNLGVFKNPHFGGSLCYDTAVEPDDGSLGVGLCEGLTALQTVATLSALRKCRFRGRPKTRSWTAKSVSVEGDRVFELETDGEVVRATAARFGVLPGRVRCAR